MTPDLQLMYLMCSRFCHDMAAPLSAIAIGLDMLPTDDTPDSPNQILKYSVQSAINKLELMRCLCGFASNTDKPSLEEAHRFILKALESSKIKLTWLAAMNSEIKGEPVRLLIALMITAFETLPRGGEIIVNPDFSINLEGSLIKLNDAVLHNITTPLPLSETSSRDIMGVFIHIISSRLGVRIIVDQPHPNSVTFKFKET